MIEFEGLRLSIFHVDFQDVRQEEKRVSLVKRNEKSVGWSRRRQKDKNRRQENTARRTLRQLQKWESFIFGSQRVSLCTRWDFFPPPECAHWPPPPLQSALWLDYSSGELSSRPTWWMTWDSATQPCAAAALGQSSAVHLFRSSTLLYKSYILKISTAARPGFNQRGQQLFTHIHDRRRQLRVTCLKTQRGYVWMWASVITARVWVCLYSLSCAVG